MGPSRRTFLCTALSAAAIGCPVLVRAAGEGLGKRDPFTLGVASGCPTPDGFVLWTRLAPDPLQGGGMSVALGRPEQARTGAEGEGTSMGSAPVTVTWEVSADERFRQVVARGRERAVAEDAHSVHVEVRGLRPGRPYWYRFTALGMRSATGRAGTASAADDNTPVRFAFASCQQYEQGYYGAYRDMAAQPLDLVVHLGDYIYESSWGSRHVRHHRGGIPTTLDEFRDRYALYKSDPDLQAAHAACPWLVTWDDHEVANDYTNDRSPRTIDTAQFLAMRAAAYKAWYEHMPVPASMRPRGPDARIYGNYRFGRMLEIVMLDGRQYRSPHACLQGRSASPIADCALRHAADRSFFGAQQEAWLTRTLAAPAPQWTVLAQPTLMAEADRAVAPEHGYWMDGWDGYTAARDRLLDTLATHRPRNPLVVSGDVHAFWAADICRKPGDAPLATEFVGGAITSEGPKAERVASLLARNPHLRYGRGDKRGYALMTLEADRCAVQFRAVDNEKSAASQSATLARFVVEDGRAGVQVQSV